MGFIHAALSADWSVLGCRSGGNRRAAIGRSSPSSGAFRLLPADSLLSQSVFSRFCNIIQLLMSPEAS